ncbi:hypothetical protein SDC9_195052 [bioreactor metagenome]|uniref:Uncharacterized protein n=1 Tax=bioreactor metagenome TaxID=1076179 RepID=A0A645I8J9_9ZZZZ
MLQVDRVAIGQQHDQNSVVLLLVEVAYLLLNARAVEPRAGEVDVRNAGKQRGELARVGFLPRGDAGKDWLVSIRHQPKQAEFRFSERKHIRFILRITFENDLI